VSTDPNTRRLMDRIDLLERVNNAQCETISAYRHRNYAQGIELDAYRALVGELSIKPRGGAKIKHRRPT
jgi:hypothetical protein